MYDCLPPLSLEKFLYVVIVASDTLMTNIHTSLFHANDANYFLSIRDVVKSGVAMGAIVAFEQMKLFNPRK
jgi:hypothetical protein